MIIQKPHIKLSIIAIAFFLLNACNPAKKLSDDQHLVFKDFVINKDSKLDKSDFENYIKLNPNRKILGFFRFHLWLNNLVNEDKVKRKRIQHDNKQEQKNTKRVAKGKKIKNNKKKLFGEKLLNISESPVIYDSFLVKKSIKQMKLFLNNKGYFINTVSDSIVYKRRKKATIYYKISTDAPYTYNDFNYKIPDKALEQYVFYDSAQTLLLKGYNYDVDIIQKERERITNGLNNRGYYLFSQDYVYFEVDTNLGNKKINVTVGIKNYAQKHKSITDSIIETPHKRFSINNIFIQPDFVSNDVNSKATDTIIVNHIRRGETATYHIIHSEKLKYKTKVLLDAIFIRKGETYELKKVEDTYKRLLELKAFKFIKIFFTEKEGGLLDCYIQLNSVFKQSFTIETEGTNTSGNLGVSGSFVFQNRNLFKGAEVLELRVKGGWSAQGPVNNTTVTSNAKKFNTVEVGPELNLYIPRFLVPFKVNPSIRSNPKTIFTSALNYQQRPDYTRTITNFSFGYTWMETVKKRHTINPFVINFVKVELEPYFYNDLFNNVHDQFILNSFSNHLSTSTRYTFIYNEQDLRKQKNFSYFKLNAESSGNILRGLYSLGNKLNANTFIKDNEGRFTLLDVPYSQYLRIDVDFRYYFKPNVFNTVVFRIAAGLGKPLTNFKVLPFERSFFSGGANGMRAWQSRMLGPGSYFNKEVSFDQFGDGQLESNLEYRFKLFKMLNGAFFVDAGNIWLQKSDPNRPGGDFQFDRFYKEIAVGSGVGVRADFSFFIIRFDLGIKVRDPQFSENQRWVIKHLFNPSWKQAYIDTNSRKYSFLAFNIGIGYPF